MSSPRWYQYSGVLVPGQRARAEDVANEFTSVQNAIENIDPYGTDSGTANSYVITTDTVPWAAYFEPQVITFKALTGNTSASQININGIGAVSLKRWDGTAAQSGDILAGSWITARYNATSGAFQIDMPPPAISGVTFATPTGKATLAASAGSLSTVARSDANFAIDLTIVPTWTGAHTFSALGTFNAGITVSNTVGTFNAGITVSNTVGTFNAGITSTNVTVTGSAVPANGIYLPSANTLGFATNTGAVGSLTSTVLTMPAVAVTGSTVPANGIYLSAANTLAFASNTTVRGTLNSTGNWTLNVPASGNSLSIGVVDGQSVIVLNDASATSGFDMVFEHGGSAVGYVGTGPDMFTGGSLSDFGIASATGALKLGYNSGNNTAVAISSVGAVTVNAPTAGNAMVVTGLANATAFVVKGAATSGQSFGMSINAGTTSADDAILITNQSGATTFFKINGDGSGTLSATTNGLQWTAAGAYTIAAPSSTANALAATGAANARALAGFGNSTTGQSFGLLIEAGTNSADAAVTINNQANTVSFLKIDGTGASVFQASVSTTTPVQVTGGSGAGATCIGATVGAVATGVGLAVLGGSSGAFAFSFGTNFFSNGTSTPTLSATKPGANNGVIDWLKVQVNSVTGWIPVFGN